MRLLLIYPHYVAEERGRCWSSEPLGLLSLASSVQEDARLRSWPLTVKILDAQALGPSEAQPQGAAWRHGLSDQDIHAEVTNFQPDVVGVTMAYTHGWRSAEAVCALARMAAPQALIVVGGAHATMSAEWLRLRGTADLVVRGEGEAALTDVCRWVADGRDPRNITGIWPPAPPLDICKLPYLDRSLVDMPLYLSRPLYWQTKRRPVATVSSSRGCQFKCAFCSTTNLWGEWRGRSPDQMLHECRELRDRWGAREVAWQDDQFLGDPERIRTFCRLAIATRLGMTHINPPGMSPALMDAGLLRLMRDAGWYRVCFSVDVGNETARRFVKKPVKLADMRAMVRTANRLGLWTYGTFVIGFPGETRQDIEETIRYAWSLGLDFVRFYIAQPHRGSKLWDIYEKAGKLDDFADGRNRNIMDAPMDTDQVKADELVRLRNLGECGYRPWRCGFRMSEWLPKVAGLGRALYAARVAIKAGQVRLRFDRRKR